MSTKRFSKGLLSIFVMLLMVFTIFACDRDNTNQLINEALDTLNVVFESGDSTNSVTKNVTLPTKVGDVTIAWSSSNPAVISNAGVVTRQFQDVNVILTATASLNDKSETKTFTLKVIGHDVNAALDAIILAGANISYNAQTDVYTIIGNITLPATSNGLAITWESLIPTVLSSSGTVIRPDYGQVDANIILIAKIGNAEREFNILVPAISEKPVIIILQEARDALLIPGISDGVSQNISLPTMVGTQGVTVTWSSNNPAVVSNLGVVDRQDENVTVILTATLHLSGQTLTKTFEVVVLAATDYVLVENIAEAIAISKDGLAAVRTYVRINNVTILGITGDGVVMADESGIIFAYMGSRLTTIEIGKVYNVRGLTDRYFGAWQLNHTAVSGSPVVFTESDGEPYTIIPVEVGSVTEMLANHHVPTAEDPDIQYVYYRLTAKVRVQNAADNYGTVLVNPDYVGGDIPTAANSAHTTDGVVIYYHSNRTALHPFDGLVVTLNILLYGYRSDRSIFNMLFLETTNDIQTTLDDAGILNVVDQTLKATYSPDYIEATTLTFPSSLLGATIAWTSSHPDLINPITGAVTMPAQGQTEVTLTATLTKGDATKTTTIKINVGELEVLTVSQVLEQAIGSKVRFKGVVTGILTNRTFAVQDETSAIAIYVATADVAAWLALVGKEVEVIGSRAAFGGLQQINPLEVKTIKDGIIPFAENIDGVPLTAEGLLPFMAKHVIRTNLVVDSLPAQSFGNVLAILKDPVTGETIPLFWDSRVVVADGNIANLQVGDVISLLGVPVIWTSNLPRFAYSHASQIYMGIYVEATDAEKAELVANAIKIDLEVEENKVMDLPTSGGYGSTIVWSSSDDAVIDGATGLVALPATGNVTVTLTALVTVGEETFTKEFSVVVGVIVRTVATARTMDVGDIITVEAIVTANNLSGTSFRIFFEDDTAGIAGFVSSPSTELQGLLTVGNKVRITGKIGAFSGQIQIVTPINVEVLETGLTPVPTVVENVADLAQHEGKLVTITAFLKTNARTMVIIDETGEMNGYFQISADFTTALSGVPVGSIVTITAPLGRFNNLQFNLFYPTAVVVGAMGAEADLNAIALANLILPEPNNEVIGDIGLPTTGLFGTVVEWTSSNEAVISNAGVVTRPGSDQENAVVNLSYVFKKGDTVISSGNIEFTVLKQDVSSDPITVTASYTGATSNMIASPANNAALISLDPELFTVTSIKGQASVEVGLNTAGQIRIYANRANGEGNTLTFSIASGYVITKVEFVFGASPNSPTADLVLGTETIQLQSADLTSVTKSYDELSITTFSIQNTQLNPSASSNAQIYILQIIITYIPVINE